METMVGRFIGKHLSNWLTNEHEPEGFPLCDFERIRYELRPGDVILVEGRSRVSEVVKVITQSPWSHSALYIGRMHDIENPEVRAKAGRELKRLPVDTQLLVEGILGQGTILSPLHHYKKDHIRICRPRGLSATDAQKVITYAINRIGTDYDVRQIFDLARFMFPWTILPRKWRSQLFTHGVGDTTRTVCSTMIAEAFASIKFPILPYIKAHEETGIELIQRNPKLMTPRDFDYSPYFEIIKYPFIDIDTRAMYRNLPWNKEGAMSHDGDNITLPKTAAKSEVETSEEPELQPEETASDQATGKETLPADISDTKQSSADTAETSKSNTNNYEESKSNLNKAVDKRMGAPKRFMKFMRAAIFLNSSRKKAQQTPKISKHT